MTFVIGPLYAGKEEYVRSALGWEDETFSLRTVRDVQELAPLAEDLSALADRLSEKEVVIATETGSGVVPTDPEERFAREQAGRLNCLLAERAENVIRVCCGLPQVLKGRLL